MTLVQAQDITSRLAIPLTDDQTDRVDILLRDAEEQIEVAFQKEGRDFRRSLDAVIWLPAEARRVIREMVSAAIIIGPNAGVRTASSATGQESDSVTYDKTDAVSFAGVRLTDEQRRDLGLSISSGPRGDFPDPPKWPEVASR